MPRCDHTAAWAQLHQYYAVQGAQFDAREALAADPQRVAKLSQTAPHIFADLSKNRIDDTAQTLLMQLARECGLEPQRDAMLRGEAINTTEQRAVLHTYLRAHHQDKDKGKSNFTDADINKFAINNVVLKDQLAAVQPVLTAMLAYAEQVRADSMITDVVNIGIGGSDLGPQMAVLALQGLPQPANAFTLCPTWMAMRWRKRCKDSNIKTRSF